MELELQWKTLHYDGHTERCFLSTFANDIYRHKAKCIISLIHLLNSQLPSKSALIIPLNCRLTLIHNYVGHLLINVIKKYDNKKIKKQKPKLTAKRPQER